MDDTLVLRSFLDDRGRLTAFPAKRKMKWFALRYLASKIEPGRVYSEAEFNDLLDEWHTFHDPATLRRELYNGRFIDRQADGRGYTLEPETPVLPY